MSTTPSMSRVKKALSVQGSPRLLVSSRQSVSPTSSHQNKADTTQATSIPEILYENEVLKEELKRLRNDNQILEEFKATYIEQNNRDITFRNSLPYPDRKELRSFHFDSRENSFPAEKEFRWSHQQQVKEDDSKDQLIKAQSQQIQMLRKKLESVERDLRDCQLDGINFKGEAELAQHQLTLKEKEIYSLQNTLDQYAELMKEQNYKIAELLKEVTNHQKLSQCASEVVSEYNVRSSISRTENALAEELKQYQHRLRDYTQVKDDNYRLRNQIAELSVANTSLFEQSYKHTVAIGHLWSVKEVEYSNINCQLKALRGAQVTQQK